MAPGFHLHPQSKLATADRVAKARPPKVVSVANSTPVDALDQDAKKHQHRQHLAETCAVAAGAFALHERKAAKKHPQHAERHKQREHVAAAVAVGAGVVAAHEKHEKKQALKQAKHLRHH